MKTFRDFFGFKNEPFKRAPDINFYYSNRMYESVLESLVYLLHSGDIFTLLTGPQGTGKTLTLQKFISELPQKVSIAYVSFPNLTFEDLLTLILEDFGIVAPSKDRNELLETLGAFISETRENDRQAVVIIDDAQNFPYETLSGIFSLSRTKGVDEKTLKIIISGRTGLEAKLASEELKGFSGDISAMLKLENMGEQEIKDYINARIARAGRSQVKINNSVVRKVARITKGNPQLINSLMERAIIAAFLDNSHTITDHHLTAAIASVNTIMTEIKKNRSRKYLYAAVAACAAGVVFTSGYFAVDKYIQNKPVLVVEVNTSQTVLEPQPIVPERPPVNTEPQETPVVVPTPMPEPVPTPEPVVVEPEPVVVVTPEPIIIPEPVTVVPTEPVVAVNAINPMPVGSTVVVTSTSLNVRALPEIDAERLAAVVTGNELIVLEDTPDWIRIEIHSGVYGWVYKRYLRLI